MLKIEIDKDCGKSTVGEILESIGYSPNEYRQYVKNGKTYLFNGWDHCNSYVYSITLTEIYKPE